MANTEREDFGPNTWLVEEMYRQYQEDPESVGETWQEFFADYQPDGDGRAPADEEVIPPKAEELTRGTVTIREPGPIEPEEAEEAEEAGDGSDATARGAAVRPTSDRSQESAPVEAEKPAAAKPRSEPARPAPSADTKPLTGIAATIARNMEASLEVPTATSFRTVSAKLLEVNRQILNRHIQREQSGGKVSFTHIIGWAIARALSAMPEMNVTYSVVDGKPHVTPHDRVNLGLAVDVKRKDGTRTLMVPNIKGADGMSFRDFYRAYEELIKRVRSNKLSPDDFAGTTVSITNPGTVGTVQSVPRLMQGQAAIIGVGAIDFPAEWKGADPDTLAELGVGKTVTLTSTYDHRVIQGAMSGEFLARVEQLLMGEELFYGRIFRSMGVPYVPVQWRTDESTLHKTPLDEAERHMELQALINIYRVRGHLIADLDPLEQKPPHMHPELDPASHGFTIWDLDRTFATGGFADEREMKLRDILALLRDAYCRSATVEYMHIQEPDQKEWIQEHVEGVDTTLPKEDKLHILGKLGESEALETFLHTKYIGHKRFSIEGGESLLPILDAVLTLAADRGIAESVIGMAHRGRLDVLTGIVGKSFEGIFREFEGYVDPEQPYGSGDVKYHIGAEGKFTAPSGNDIRVSVASNPSHLEAVDPVAEGMARAKQDLRPDVPREQAALPLVIHGDAAFAGQGVVAETFAMSALHGFGTGGTVHVIVNNQLGFTTGSDYGRSSTYASDVAKMVQAPIWHVNGDDPEACVRAARLAFEFRQRFKKDVVIDMWCYRKWGHNEGDDPSFTQPKMYGKIKGLRSIRKRYLEHLVNRGDLTVEEGEQALQAFKQRLDEAFDAMPRDEKKEPPHRVEREEPKPVEAKPDDTAVGRDVLDEVVDAVTTVPEGFAVHPKLQKWLDERKQALDNDQVDWSLAEDLAFGTLLLEGRTIRLSGQDSRRGTFSQRHSVLVDQETGEEHVRLSALAQGDGSGGRFYIYDSLLSEFGVMGFEYGYSVSNPDALVMWEAQFGDFVNEAQVVVDQFISAAEDKWQQTSGLTLLLPHGFEGQGPEHSSARLERFLQQCAEENMVVAVPSTPAQYFHLLRRQALRERKKPLIVMTPKSFLRLKEARSAEKELTEGRFQEVLGDPAPPEKVERVVLCQGKFFWDLWKAREDKPVAVVRVEQLYPFPGEAIKKEVEKYSGAEVVWAQEEPENMGAAWFVQRNLRRFGIEASTVARETSGSPATGSLTLHQREQEQLTRASLKLTTP